MSVSNVQVMKTLRSIYFLPDWYNAVRLLLERLDKIPYDPETVVLRSYKLKYCSFTSLLRHSQRHFPEGKPVRRITVLTSRRTPSCPFLPSRLHLYTTHSLTTYVSPPLPPSLITINISRSSPTVMRCSAGSIYLWSTDPTRDACPTVGRGGCTAGSHPAS